MKKTVFIALVASLLAVGCNHKRIVDETVETDRYTLHIQDASTYTSATDNSIISYYFKADTCVFSNSVPQMAYFLVSHHGLDSTTMYHINLDKQSFLPKYVYTIIDHDTTQPTDYMPLIQALIDRGILRTDTTHEPLQQLVVFDSARLEAHRSTEWLDEEPYTINIASIVVQMQEHYRMPVSIATDVDMYIMVEGYTFGEDTWQADSLWLDERGLRVVPDPQGRQMRIIEFNRAKGRI